MDAHDNLQLNPRGASAEWVWAEVKHFVSTAVEPFLVEEAPGPC